MADTEFTDLQEALDAAILLAFATHRPDLLVSGWVMTVQGMGAEAEAGWTNYTTMAAPNQPMGTTLGMQRVGQLYFESDLRGPIKP